MNVNGLVAQLKRRRVELGMSLDDLGHITGFSARTHRRVEQGNLAVCLGSVLAAADALGLGVELKPEVKRDDAA